MTIDKNLIAEYLDPAIWNRLQEIMEIVSLKRRILYVLEEEEKYKTVYQGKACEINKPVEMSEKWVKDRFPDTEEVRVYTIEGIEDYFREIQKDSIYEMDIVQYLEYMYQSLHTHVQVFTFYKQERPLFWKILEKWSKKNGVYNIGIERNQELYFHCILQFENGALKRITTFDRYGAEVCGWKDICRHTEEEFGGGVTHVYTTLEELKLRFGLK